MKTATTTKALVLFVAGVSCAAIALSAIGGGAPANVSVTETTMASGESMPVVTVTAKKLTATQKLVLAVRTASGSRT